jgi:lipid II:glycine glycyltransferase (peptidoglycan interpeptide bridge formation enzyme)
MRKSEDIVVNNTTEFHFALQEEIADWDSRVVKNPDEGNFLQSVEFSEQKKANGWKPRFLVAGDIAVLVLERRIGLFFVHWYVPKGPGVRTAEQLKDVLGRLAKIARRSRACVMTIDPELPNTSEVKATVEALHLQPRFNIQANVFTKVMDITPALEEQMTNLSQKTRHAINRAKRDGVVVKKVAATDENCKIMHDLMIVTAGGRFPIYPFAYYKNYWQLHEAAGKGAMFFAYVDDTVVACSYTYFLGHKGVYKDGASVRDRPAYGASHLLQWHMIEWLQKQGVTTYDLCGVPPIDQQDNPEHKLHGVGRFKAGFVRETVEYIGTYDVIVRPILGMFWHKFGERLAQAWYRRVRHVNYY